MICMAELPPKRDRDYHHIDDAGLVIWIIYKYAMYRRYLHMEDDLIAEGLLALYEARRAYKPKSGTFSNFATTYIRNALTSLIYREQRQKRYKQEELFHIKTGNTNSRRELKSLKYPNDLRPIPSAPNWNCVNCNKCIDWSTIKKTSHYGIQSRGLCASCERARGRAKQVGYGQGVCAKCAKVIRSKHCRLGAEKGFSRPWCGCYPIWPCYTLEDLNGPPELA